MYINKAILVAAIIAIPFAASAAEVANKDVVVPSVKIIKEAAPEADLPFIAPPTEKLQISEPVKIVAEEKAVVVNPTKEFGVINFAGQEVPWLRMLVAFAFVASLIIMIALIARRFMNGGASAKTKRAAVRVVQSIPLGMKRHLVVVDFEGARILVGMGPNGMQTLHSTPKNSLEAAVAYTANIKSDTKAAVEDIKDQYALDPVPPALRIIEQQEKQQSEAATQQTAVSSSNLAKQIREAVKSLKPLYPDQRS